MSDSGYSAPRRRLHHQFEHLGEQQQQQLPSTPAPKIVYPSMQVVNIEMATGDGAKKFDNHHQHHYHQRHHMPAPSTGPLTSLIDQADYEASMGIGKMFGKPENIRTYGAMIRANEEHVERNQTGFVKKDRATVLPKRGLPLSEYNRALQEGEISPARDDEITNPDESSSQVDHSDLHHRQHQQQQQYHQRYHRRPLHDMSDSGYSAPRRRLHHQFEHLGND